MALFDAIRLGASGAGGDYEVERSLRFNNADNTRIQRAIGSTSNRRTFTYSFWLKRTLNSAEQYFFYNGPASGTPYFDARFEQDSHELQIADYTPGGSPTRPIRFITNRKFRDPNAWYHFVVAVDTTQGTESNRFKLYVNGVQETSFSTAVYPSQNYDSSVNVSGHIQGWGTNQEGTSGDYDGYLAEAHFIDGLQLTPSSFAETDAVTGQWKPKKYAGAYGTNGNYLNFSDNSNTTAATLGKDSSGNGNNFTPHNFSVSAGAGNDSLEDSPTNNFPTINPLAGYSTNFVSTSNGNLDFSLANNYWAISSFKIPASGKWYAECVFTDVQTGDFGVFNPNMINDDSNGFDGRWNGVRLLTGGSISLDNTSVQSSLTAISNGAIVGVKIDRDAGTVAFTINGSANGSAVNISGMVDSSTLAIVTRRNSSSGSNPIGSHNYGQRPFSHLPAGYKALSSANLPDPTIKLPNKHFDTLLYTGDGGSSTALAGLSFQPDFGWFKSRSSGANHDLYDSVRGGSARLIPNSDSGESSYGNLIQSFNSNGYTLGTSSEINGSGLSLVAWNWKGGGSASSNTDGSITSSVSANTSAGFSVVTYTGTGSNATVGHGLGVAPKCFIVKRRDSSGDWAVYHYGMGTHGMQLNSTGAQADEPWWNGHPTSSVINLKTSGTVNGSSATYVAYVFSEVAGYSNFGSYIGNGNADGVFVYLGFRPAYVMVKKSSGGDSWLIMDNKRDVDNVVGNTLAANSAGAENVDTGGIPTDFLSNGFKCRGSGGDFNASGSTFIYLAFAESPYKYSRAR